MIRKKFSQLRLVVLTVSMFLSSYYAFGQQWQTLNGMPAVRTQHASAAFNGKVYIINGSVDGFATLSSLLVYDVQGNSWTTGTAPSGVSNRGGDAVSDENGTIYYASGEGGSSNKTLYKYVIATNTWSEVPGSANKTAWNGSLAYGNGKLFYTGGEGKESVLSIYNISTNTWSTGASIPNSGGMMHTSAVVGNKLYMIGGTANYNPGTQTVKVYDIPSNTWTTLPSSANFPHNVYYFNAIAYDGNIYLTGGQSSGMNDQGSQFNYYYKFITSSSTWERLPDLPTTQGQHTLVELDAKIYSIGGRSSGAFRNYVYMNVLANGGVVASNQTFCPEISPFDPAPFTSISGAIGGSANFSYEWEKSTDGTNWTTIVGATSLTYDVPSSDAVSATTYYRRKATDVSTIVVYSNIITVTKLIPLSISSQPSTSSQTICKGVTASSISVSALGNTLSYQWYSNTQNSNAGGTLIAGATSNSYTPLTTNVSSNYYYCVVTDAAGCTPSSITSDVSGLITVNDIPSVTLGTISNIANSASAFQIPFGSLLNGANQYSVISGTTALAGFTAVNNATISGTSGNFIIPIPQNSASGTYDFLVSVKNSTTGCISQNYSKTVSIANIPTVQATNIVLSNQTSTTATISWTNGNGSARTVFIKSGNSGTANPVNNTTYTANTTFGSGTQIGTTGWYCVYRGAASTVNVTGLTSGTDYQIMVTEYNGTFSFNNSQGTNNPVTVQNLTVSPSTLSFTGCPNTNSDSQTFTVTASNPNADISVNAPSGFEISNSANGVFSSSLTIANTGIVTTTTVFVRMSASSVPPSNGSITITSNNAAGKTIALSGNITTIRPFKQALNFDGVNDKVTIPHTSELQLPNTFTLEAWVYVDPSMSSSSRWGIVSKNVWVSGGSATSGLGYGLDIEGGKPRLVLGRNDGAWSDAAATSNITTGTWVHVAGTYDGTNARLYINGILSKTTATANFWNNNGAALTIGSWPGENKFFKGNIDEVRVWNVTRTATEILQNKDIELAGNETGLVSYYNFNHGTPSGTNSAITTLTDNATTASNGTLNSFALTGATSNWIAGGPMILNESSLCLNGTTVLAHTNSGGTWSTSDANIISIDPATSIATANAAGTATITYTFTDGTCSFTSTKSFTVNALPAAPSATTTVNYCQNVTASALTATALAGNTLQWYTVANAGTATTTAYTPLTTSVGSTLYYVSQKNSTLGCEGPRTAITVAVSSLPAVAASSNSFCSGTPITLTLTGYNGNIQWQSSSNNSTWTNLTGATSDTYTVTNLTATTYYRSTVSGGTCSTTTNVSTISLAKAAGDFGSALNFDGTDDVVSVPNNTALNISGNISVEAWIKPASGGTNIQNVISKSTSSGVGSNTGYIFPRTDDNWGNFNGYLHIGGLWRSVSSPYPTDGLFHHLAMTYDGTNIRLYLDGNLVKTQAQTGTIATNTNSLALGNQPGFTELFKGTLDEARIWNAALTADQIKSRMNIELGGTETNLVLNYNFNQGVPSGSNASVVSESNIAATSLVGTLTNFAKSGASSNYVLSTVVNPIGGSTLCIGSPLQLTHPNSGGTWSIPATTGLSISNTGALAGTLSTTATSVVVSYDYTINACSFTSTKTINITQLIAGTASGNQTLCSSAAASAITLAGNTSGSTIQWQSSSDNTTFSNISNATAASLSPGSLTSTTYYRAAVTTAACGTLYSNVITKGYNNSLSFDGTDDYVEAGAPLPIAANDNFTYEAWVRPTLVDANYRGFLGTSVLNVGRAPSMWVGPNGSLHTDSYNGSTRYDMLVNNFFTANTWVHVAWVKNGTTYTIYRNGVQVDTRTAPSSVLLPNANFTIGKLDNFFAGTLDEVRIWNTARTAQEITDNMSATLNGNETGLRAYYTFNQGTPDGTNTSINTVANLTATANLNGTLTAFAKTGTTSNFVGGFRAVIATQPVAPTAVCLNASSNTISVTAYGSGITYQWYTNTANSTTGATAITNATTNSYEVPTNVAGTKFYYVVVTGACSSAITSNIVSQVINSSTFTTQPSTAAQNIAFGGTATALTVASPGATAYQWYSNTSNSNTGGTAITGATSATYTPSTSTPGALYYYAVATGGCSTATSALSGLITVGKATPTIASMAAINKTFGDAAFTLTAPTSNATGAFTFTSSNTAVATISGTTVTIVGAGTATITATQATDANYNGGSVSALLTVAKANPTIASMAAINKTFGDAAFTLTAPTSNATGAFTFTSSNTAVATISGTTVTIVGAGTATITATQTTDANYNAGSVSALLTVAKANPTIASMAAISKTFGNPAFPLTVPTSNSNGAFTFTSSNTAVATILNNLVTIVGAGTATITATQAATANYNAGSVTATLTVAKANPTITILSNITRAYGSVAVTLVAPSSNSNGAFTYTISDASVATISGATLTAVGIGTATITTTQAESANYNAGSVTRTITVVKGTPTIGTFAAINKTFGDAAFTLTAPSSTSTGAFTYASDNTAVATVSGATVTIVGAGTANITATQAADANYNAGSVSAVLTVAKAARTLSAFADINKTTTDAPFTLVAPTSSAGTGAITYASSNAAVATVSGSTVTITGIGTSIITATQAADDNYLEATITATLTVILGDSDGDGVPDDVEIRDGTDPNNPSSVKDSDGDGVPDYVEIGSGTNPNSPADAIDSDGDGLSDYYEARNAAPTNIALSATTINENNTAGAAIVDITATDVNIGETFTYTLVAGTGDADNASFTINGSSLMAVNAFDFETRTTYSLRLKVTDKGGLSYEKEFVITVADVNEAPTALALSNASVLENAASGTTVGTLAGTDADAGDTHTYTLVSGTGSTDNASFTITGTTLSTAAVFNFEAKNSYAVRVRVTDAGGLTFERAFTISVTDVNEAPTLTAITDRRVYNVSTSQVVNLAGITAGPETAQSTTTTVSTDKPATFSSINVVGTQIQFTLAAGIVTPQDVVVTVRVKDNGGVANGGVDTLVRTFKLGIDPMPVAAASPNLITLGATAQLSAAGSNAINYTWVAVGGSGIVGSGATINVRPKGTTTYAVVVTNSFGYQATIPVLLTVIVDYKLVPNNLITPNGDGVNDKWVIPNIDMYPDNEVMVYDKAGRAVFSKRGYNNEWDGTVNGTKLKEDAYFYVIKFNKDGALPIRGYVSIVR
jgi:gliding motility-associated-like protein